MSRRIDRTGMARHMRQPPHTNRRAENALACFFIIAVIAAGLLL